MTMVAMRKNELAKEAKDGSRDKHIGDLSWQCMMQRCHSTENREGIYRTLEGPNVR